MELLWVTTEDALNRLSVNVDHYTGRFISYRDATIIKAAQKVLS